MRKNEIFVVFLLLIFVGFVGLTTFNPAFTALATEKGSSPTGFAVLTVVWLAPIVIIVFLLGYFAFREIKKQERHFQ